MVDKDKVLAGRKAVDAYRDAHNQLSTGMSEEHTPLLEKLIADLEKIGITSVGLAFEPKKTEILSKFFGDNASFIAENAPRVYMVIGECNKCGKCCEGCEHLTDEGLCAIQDNKPEKCRNSPVPLDLLRGFQGFEVCSYSLQLKSDAPDDLRDFDFKWR